mmetsp:Transcript_105817/g.306088  ORF Transcript_105817/g.306088 Transcript_105817/m.306088 type:complete len:233 (+) Transcript_105817:2175-2873(+)
MCITACSSRELRNAPRAFSCIGGFPSIPRIKFSTFSQSQDHANSCEEPQSVTKDRKDESITVLYSRRLIDPLYLDKRRTRTLQCSNKFCDFATLDTMPSMEARTSNIHNCVLKPMTAALNKNMSLKFVGICELVTSCNAWSFWELAQVLAFEAGEKFLTQVIFLGACGGLDRALALDAPEVSLAQGTLWAASMVEQALAPETFLAHGILCSASAGCGTSMSPEMLAAAGSSE